MDNTQQTLFSTSYLPLIYYVKEAVKNQNIYIEAYENYQKQSLRNRTFIYSAQGLLCLSIPVQKKTNELQYTKDIKIDYSTPWQRTHWRAMVSAYNSAPFFLYYQDYFKPFFENNYTYLLDFNNALLEVIFKNILKISIQMHNTTTYIKANKEYKDFRNLCNQKNNNLEKLELINYNTCKYYQVFQNQHGFIENLSIIDLIFNEGNNALNFLKA